MEILSEQGLDWSSCYKIAHSKLPVRHTAGRSLQKIANVESASGWSG